MNDEKLRVKPLAEAPAVALILVFDDFFFFDATISTLKKFQTNKLLIIKKRNQLLEFN